MGAVTEHGVVLEMTVKLCVCPLCPHIVHSLNNSPRDSSPAIPVRKLRLFFTLMFLSTWITVGPVSLKVNTWAAKGGTQVESKICAVVDGRVCLTEGVVSSEQETGAVVITEQFWMGVDKGFWFWLRVYGLRVKSGSPKVVWWASLLVCLSGDDRS